MIYFLIFQGVLLYLLNLAIKRYWKFFSSNFKGTKKVLLITATSRVEKVMARLLESDDVFGN